MNFASSPMGSSLPSAVSVASQGPLVLHKFHVPRINQPQHFAIPSLASPPFPLELKTGKQSP